MKSAYEKAMEKLEAEQGPTRKLTDDQKARIAEIDKKYEARIAETRLSYESRLNNAGSAAEADEVRHMITSEVEALEEERAQEKEAVWNE